MFEDKTVENILSEMLAGVPNDLDKREGAVIYNALAPAAVEIYNIYGALNWIYQETFPDTASRDGLVRRCEERGIEPYPATHTILRGDFKVVLGETAIYIGQRFSAVSSDHQYEVLEQILDEPLVSGYLSYKMKCSTAGEVGNKYLGPIIPIDYKPGLKSSELTDVLVPGEDEEGTEALRERYYMSLKAQAFGGNRADYVNKTNSIDGVGGTKVHRISNVENPEVNAANEQTNVSLVIMDSNFQVPDPGLVELVQEEIDPTMDGEGLGAAPIDHIVQVTGVSGVTIDIEASVDIENGYFISDVQLPIEEAIKAYFKELRQTWEKEAKLIVRLSQIENRILDVPGILDVQNVYLNETAANIELTANEIPIFGSVNLSLISPEGVE